MKDIDKFLTKQEKRIEKLKQKYKKKESEEPKKIEKVKEEKKSKKRLIYICLIFVFFLLMYLFHSDLSLGLSDFLEFFYNLFNFDIFNDCPKSGPTDFVS
jgi:hypothetical protein